MKTLPLPPKWWLWFIHKRKTSVKDVILPALGLTADTNNSDLLYKELYTCEKQGKI